MHVTSNSRRAGPSREHRSSSGGGDTDIEKRQDDKNSKAESADDHTVNFVVGLLVAVLLVCGGLWYVHVSRAAVEVKLAKPSVNGPLPLNPGRPTQIFLLPEGVIHTATPKPTESKLFPVNDKSEHKTQPQRYNVDGHSKSFAKGTNAESKSVIVPTPITWQGCRTTLPDPNPTLDPAPVSANKHGPYEYNRRHIVPPPAGPVSLVCCNTTKGVLNIEVHPTWAPNGAARFLHMVRIVLIVNKLISPVMFIFSLLLVVSFSFL